MLHAVHRGGSAAGGSASSRGGSGWGRGVRGRGQGTFQSSCHVLHYHMVLRPRGTSHNEAIVSFGCYLSTIKPNKALLRSHACRPSSGREVHCFAFGF